MKTRTVVETYDKTRFDSQQAASNYLENLLYNKAGRIAHKLVQKKQVHGYYGFHCCESGCLRRADSHKEGYDDGHRTRGIITMKKCTFMRYLVTAIVTAAICWLMFRYSFRVERVYDAGDVVLVEVSILGQCEIHEVTK